MATRRIIHSDSVNLKDWVGDRKEIMEGKSCCKSCKNNCENNCENCNDFYSVCADLNSDYFSDESLNLNKVLDNYVIAFADLGLWNGRKPGYRILGNNLNSIFNISEDSNTYYADGYNIHSENVHHDGTNYILYRKLKSSVDRSTIEYLLYKNNFKLTKQQISKYTESLLPYVKDIYGW